MAKLGRLAAVISESGRVCGGHGGRGDVSALTEILWQVGAGSPIRQVTLTRHVYSVHNTLYSIQYTIYSVQYTVHNTLYSIQYTIYSAQCTLSAT